MCCIDDTSEFSGNSGSSGISFSKANALPVEISSTNEKPEPISVPVKLERSKTANILSKEAAMIFDDKTSVHQKVLLSKMISFFLASFYRICLSLSKLLIL